MSLSLLSRLEWIERCEIGQFRSPLLLLNLRDKLVPFRYYYSLALRREQTPPLTNGGKRDT